MFMCFSVLKMSEASFTSSQLAEIELILLQNEIDLDNIQRDILESVLQAIQSREDQLVSGTYFHFWPIGH